MLDRGTPDQEPAAAPRLPPESSPTPGPPPTGAPAAAPSRRVPLSATTGAWALCGVTLLLLAAHVVALYEQRGVSDPPWGYRAATVVGYAGIPVVGALIVSRVPRHPSGWVWLGLGLSLSLTEATTTVTALRGLRPPGWVADAVSGIAFTSVLVLLTLVFLLFPDGRLPSRRWRWVSRAAIATGCVLGVAAVVSYLPGDDTAGRPRPPPPDWLIALVESGILVLFCLVLVSIAAVPVRWRRAGPTERQQLKWFLVGAIWVALGTLLLGPLSVSVPAWLDALINVSMFLALPGAAAVAILRYRLYDVDRVLNRTLLYAGVSALLAGVYVLVVSLTPILLTDRVPGMAPGIATAAVALLVLPVRSRLQRAVNRLTFGRRGDPYVVIAELGVRLEAAAAPATVLPGIVDSVARTLRLPYVAIHLSTEDGDVPIASSGLAVGDPVAFPLLHEGRSVGRLVASPRTVDDELSATDRRLLADVAGHAGVAAHAVLLARDIRRSRTRVLAAREEERRRIRRDLHDGLGPTLAAVVLGLETARRRCDVSPQQAGALIDRLASDVQDTIGDIRRLVHDLRPPILDQLGLADAIRADARRFETDSAATREPLFISVDAPSVSPPLPAAVEVATYRIAGEALTNVVRHAGAHHCVVRLAFDDGVELEVRDDGRGLPVDGVTGVGLQSMSERAADVGGRCQVDSPDGGGTRVLARLPGEAMP